MKELKSAITVMKKRIVDILDTCSPSIYIYGSFVLDDFKLGWSDIDIRCAPERSFQKRQQGNGH